MKISGSVFGSENEKELFKTLQSNWSDRFDLWPNLPFTNIIDIGSSQLSAKEEKFIKELAEYLWPNLTSTKINEKINDIVNFRLSAKEEKFIYKTSVDYTLCKKDGKPLLSIEFDGLGHGFSRNGEYVQLVSNKDKYRKLKLDLKLRIAREIGYPLFVISYDEKEPIGPELHLTIVDGIIGMALAGYHTQYLINNLPLDKEWMATLPEDESHDYVEQLVWEAELEAELKWNPFERLTKKYLDQAKKKGLWLDYIMSYFPASKGENKNSVTVGSIVQTDFGEIRKETTIRDIHGLGTNLACSISKYLACKEAFDLYSKRG